MPLISSPLLREWDLLQEHVVPHLLESRQDGRRPQAWSVGSVADAVAVVTAYRHAQPDDGPEVEVFASGAERDLSPVTFSLSEIRCVPAGPRSASFERQDHRWVPGSQITRQVFLSEPGRPVDLVTLRPDAGDDLTERAIAGLRDGGYLLFLEPVFGSDPSQPADRHGSLRAVNGSRRMFRKCARTNRRPARPEPAAGTTLEIHQAQSDLVAGHARLARSLARRFSHHGESKDDLEQVALMALVKAARRYDPSREASFSTYATASVIGEIKRHFRDKTWMMRVPRAVQESYLAVKEARESLTHELACSPTIQQIAARLDTSDEAVLEAMEAGENYWPESLDAGVFEGEAGRDVPVTDSGFELTLERQQLSALLPRLAPRERLILKRLYFDGWTQRQVAEEIGVSQMQVSRVLSRTIGRLRDWISD
ncbi:MAG: sigma-70 family RNA polymerase sigma factor [Actinomycetota bacterium]|nr:sigma-70 family RNA polymerase sigma factor [Actinomycetota bacterium]